MHSTFLKNAIIFVILHFSPAFALYNSPDIIKLDFDSLNENNVMASDIWLLEFYTTWCTYCQAFAPEYEKAATALKGTVKVAAINCDEDKRLADKFKVKSYPTVLLVGNDVIKEYKGERNSEELVKFVKDSIKGDTVKQLNDDNFDELVFNSDKPWMVVFHAPWCEHCKNLKSHWIEAAKKLKYVNFGGLDATQYKKVAQKYINKGYPTIRYFKSKSPLNSLGEIYEGNRDADGIIEFIQEKDLDNFIPQVTELTSINILQQSCEEKLLCILSFLPTIIDCPTDCRNNYINILKEVAAKYKKHDYGWVWAAATSQRALEIALEIGEFDYPALVVVNYKKLKMSPFRGSFSVEGIEEFLNDIRSGKGSSLIIKADEFPTINRILPWDGKDFDFNDEL